MAKVADYGLMIWDAKSTGTLSNVIELLSLERSSRIFINKLKEFVTVGDPVGLKRAVEIMSESAKAKADEKIGLSKRIAALEKCQFQLAV